MNDDKTDTGETPSGAPGEPGRGVSELELARAVRALDREMAPSRDLWAGIERNIIDHPQPAARGWHRSWMPYGVAASMTMAMAALVFSLVGNQTPEPAFVSYDDAIDGMEAEYLQVRNPMVQQFNETNEGLDPATMQEIYRNIEIMAQARRDIEAQVRANPENERLVEMLMRIHEQEIELLKQDYTRPRSM